MIDVVESGRSPHVATGAMISGAPEELVIAEHDFLGAMTDPDGLMMFRSQELPELWHGGFFLPRTMTIRQAGKKANHGLNYDMRYKRFALQNEMTEIEAKPICERYHSEAYPGIRDTFHTEVRDELKKNDRTLVNLLGRKVRLMDQAGPDLWDKAYSFKPQSTVADIILRGMVSAYRDMGGLMQSCGLRANVHDSVLVNWPDAREDDLVPFATRMVEYLSPELECKGRRFTLGVDVKVGPNWGAMEKLRLPKAPKHVVEELPEHGRSGRGLIDSDPGWPPARQHIL